jgi:magnesium transporter
MTMIRSTYVLENKLVTLTGFPPSQELDAKVVWLDITAPTPEELAELRQRYRIDPGAHRGSVVEENEYLYMQAYLVMPGAEGAPKFGRAAFVLGERIIVTICDAPDFAPFGAATQRWGRRAAQIDSAKALLRVLLQVVNDGADLVIENITDSLEETTDQISAISDGYNEEGKELGVSDLEDTMLDLNEKEELISKCLECQLGLARVVRYLNGEVDGTTEPHLQMLVDELAADVAGVKEHAAFEHDKIRYLQSAATGILNIKQSQIVKVFTIITAVFLPPTLVATFYGMNFAVMPELSWKHGFTFSMFLTLLAALLPLIYIKRKGWLR